MFSTFLLLFIVDNLIEKRIYSRTCHKRQLKKKTKIGLKDQFLLNAGQKYCRMLQVKCIAECSKGSILQYFRPSLSYNLSFCLF